MLSSAHQMSYFKAFLTVATVNNVKFQKSKMAAAAIWRKPKLRYLGNGLTNRHEIWHGDAVRPP